MYQITSVLDRGKERVIEPWEAGSEKLEVIFFQ